MMNKLLNLTHVYRHAFLYLFKKELRKVKKEATYSFLSSVLNMSLYLLIFGNLVGQNINLDVQSSYLNFIMPGILMMNITTASFITVSSSIFQSKTQKDIEEVIYSPLPNLLPVLSYTLTGTLKGFLSGSVVLLSVFAINQKIPSYPLLLMLYIFLTSSVFSLLGFICALKARSLSFLTNIQNYFFTPFILLGGIYYPVDGVAPIWMKITRCNPGYYLVRGFRYAICNYDGFQVGQTYFLLSLIILLLALFYYAIHLLDHYKQDN